MFFKTDTTIVSWGDFLDVYHKLRQKGLPYLMGKLNVGSSARVAGKWDNYVSSSDFWVIPEIQADWNCKISGSPDMQYEEYVAQKYLTGKTGLKILSVGCGNGNHERAFARQDASFKITGVDISTQRIASAREAALIEGLDIEYRAGDFFKMDFGNERFDVVLFSSSLHHFENIGGFLKNSIKPLMKSGAFLVVFEFCGPNRLQWRQSQLKEANRLLKVLPPKYKMLYYGKALKKKVYRPGLIRMFMVDPSEAPDADNLVAGIHENFKVVEEAKLGWNILHLILKGISHNFTDGSPETKKLLQDLITAEKSFTNRTGENDAVFGVYQKR